MLERKNDGQNASLHKLGFRIAERQNRKRVTTSQVRDLAAEKRPSAPIWRETASADDDFVAVQRLELICVKPCAASGCERLQFPLSKKFCHVEAAVLGSIRL